MPKIKKLPLLEARKIAAGEVIEGPCNIVKELIEHKADVNLAVGELSVKKSALHRACWHYNYEITQLLLENGANANANVKGITGLIACYYDTPLLIIWHRAMPNDSKTYLEFIKLLVKHNADVNLKNNEEVTFPLKEACSYGCLDIITFLLKSNADPNLQDKFGNTALHLKIRRFTNALKKQNAAIIQTLIHYGASETIKDNSGKTPLDCANENDENEKPESLQALKEALELRGLR